MNDSRDLGRKIRATGASFLAPAQEPNTDSAERDYRGLTQEEIAEAVLSGQPAPNTPAYPTEAARYIAERLVPEFLKLFLEKNSGYGNMHDELGLKAQFVDINRKNGKLRRAIWDGKPIGPEPVREVILDMIGHLFLTLELMDADDDYEGPVQKGV